MISINGCIKSCVWRSITPFLCRSFSEVVKPRKKVTVSSIASKYRKGEKIVECTAYTYPEAVWTEHAGVDIVLVGDSVGMTDMGYSTTLPVTLEDTILFCKCVNRGATHPLLIGDMPFGSYEESISQCIHNCVRVIKEGGMDAVKLEGGVRRKAEVEALTKSGIAVQGHIGLTPQSVGTLGGFKVQGKNYDGVMKLIEDAKTLEAAGCFSIIIECVPELVGDIITSSINVPTIGIGAGASCSGQVLVMHDMLGMLDHPCKPKAPPSFCKQYCNIAEIAHSSLSQYVKDVKGALFPAPENNTYKITEAEKEKILELRERIAKAAGVKLSADEGETTKLYYHCLFEMSLELKQKVSFLNKDICFIAEKRMELDLSSSLEKEAKMVEKNSALDMILQQKEDMIVRCLQQYNQLSDITIDNLEAAVDNLMNDSSSSGSVENSALIQEFESKVDSCRKRILEDDGMMINVVETDPNKKFRCPITGSTFVNPVKNKRCNHTYEHDAILQLLGNKRSIPCPVAGCAEKVSKGDLVDDSDMLWMMSQPS